MKIIFETTDKRFRITEQSDIDYDLDNLKGDTYNQKVNPEIDKEDLKSQEKAFERKVAQEGVFGYVLESWNSAPGVGYEHMDSCWGFVGAYEENKDSENHHYIVDEMKDTAQRKASSESMDSLVKETENLDLYKKN